MMGQQKLPQAFPALGRYAATVLAVVCTLAIRLVFDPMLGDRAPFLFFVLVIVVVKRLWGRGPGLLATLLGGIAAWYFILAPRFSLAIANRIDALNLACYFAVGVGISFLAEVSVRLPSSMTVAGRTIRPRVVRQTAVLAGAAVVLVGMVLLLERDFKRTQDAQGWVVHSYRVMNSAESLLSMMKDGEIGERGFMLSGDERYLAPYNSATAALPNSLKELKALTSDNPHQQSRWFEIKRLTDERMAILKRGIELRRASGVDAAIAAVRSRQGVQVMDELRSALNAAMSEEQLLLVERTAIAKDQASRERWVLGLGSVALIILLVFASVVIERETVRREEITEALRRHADLLEQAHDSLLICRLGGAIGYWNRGAETLFGYTREEALGRSSHALLQTDHPLGMARIDAMLERDGQWKGELTQTTKDGRKLVVEAQWTVAVGAKGEKTVMEANRDITERKRAEAENLLLATAIEQAAETVVITDRDAKIQYVNPAFTRTTGYTHDEALGQNPRVLKSGQHDAKFYQELWATLAAGKLWHGEFTNRRKDGTLYMEEATIAPVRDASGEITNYIAIKSDITERKRGELALRESERMLRLFVQHAPAAIAMLDREMRYLVVSERWLSDYRLGNRDIRGLSHYEIFPEISERWKEIHHRCLAGAVERCKEDPFPRADGGTDWLSWEVRPWRRADDSIGGIIIFSELITERKQAEEALRASEARLRTLGDNLPEGAIYRFCQDANGNQYLDFISAGIEHLTGVPQAEVAQDVMAAFRTILPEDFERMKAAIAVSRERLTPFEIEVRHQHHTTGELRWSLLRSSPFRNPDGTTVWDGFEFDITRMKQIEGSLRESESRERARAEEFQALMDAAPVGIFRSDDTECRWMTGNRRAYDLLRTPRGSNLSKTGPEGEKPVNFRAMNNGKEIPLAELPMQKAAATGQAVRDSEMDFVFEDGVTVNVLGHAVPLLDESGRPRGAIGSFVDITEHRQAEKALEESELHYRQLFERSESALGLYEMLCDAQGNPRDFRFLNVNPAFERITGLTRNQIVGHSALEITPGLEEYWIKLFGRVAATGEPANFEHYTGPLGRYYAGTAYSPRPNQVAVTFMDVTERRRAEEEVRQLNVELEERVRSRTAALGSRPTGNWKPLRTPFRTTCVLPSAASTAGAWRCWKIMASASMRKGTSTLTAFAPKRSAWEG